MKNEITLIADNGGGFTLQIVNNDNQYQHYYSHVTMQIAEDVFYAINNSDSIDWDNNDIENGLLIPTQNEIDNGGYRVLYVNDYQDIENWEKDMGWFNIIEFKDFFKQLIG